MPFILHSVKFNKLLLRLTETIAKKSPTDIETNFGRWYPKENLSMVSWKQN
jgi:hypothetical protein